MSSFAKLSTTTPTNSAKPKAAQSAHHHPGSSGNAKNSNNDRKMKNSQQQQQQVQRNQRPIVPFGRKDRILLVGEGESDLPFLPNHYFYVPFLRFDRSMHCLYNLDTCFSFFLSSFLLLARASPPPHAESRCSVFKLALAFVYILLVNPHRGMGNLTRRTMS